MHVSATRAIQAWSQDMVLNAAGSLAVAEVVFRPHLLVPKLVIEGTHDDPLLHDAYYSF